MKTLEYVKTHINEIEQDDFFGKRFTSRFLNLFVPTEEWESYGFEYTGDGNHVSKEWNEANVLNQLKEDVGFGIYKAQNHRGISASLMYEVVKAWCIVLENGLENTPYGYYGDEMFKAVDEYYHFGLVDDTTFDKEFYEELLLDYADKRDSKLDEIEGYYSKKDYKNYEIRVHGIKSTSKLIGAFDLSEKAKFLEDAAKNGDEKTIEENHSVLIIQYKKLMDTISKLLEQS